MAIPRMLAPNINVIKSCTNCRHDHQKSTFDRCVKCLSLHNNQKPFPLHEVADIED